ncbi:hypothetical protein [Klenkia taihuensis]|uniref:Uncharacterized protein n=1 Tax=Klenkia taihuensis TaxID=1225127 RepID=A0A1I1HII9_9ACTN|nr:hypothetical protein [Klenkia taihuensis]GHE09256.1 hypothetical protein GCM10011381_13310 [Klenkia taihuensis]SFC21778.1 hypothetical protein SAMN05661030_0404 [Klenkia taihuensis]
MTHAQDPRTPDATDDLLTGRDRDAAGREHDVVTEATAEAAAGTTGRAVTEEDRATGVVTDR